MSFRALLCPSVVPKMNTLLKKFTIHYSLFTILFSMVTAHESPEHNLIQLTAHLKTERSPEHLLQRALAYRALGQLENATSDLNTAINLTPDHFVYQLELSRTLLAASKPDKALNAANRSLKLAETPAQRATCHILRAEAYQNSRRYKPSLHACQLAFRQIPQGEIEWFLLQSENQRQLGQHQQRIANLKTGLNLHHSAVLKAHWIDALIDAGDFKTSLPLIEAELVDRRWKSSWLIKQARTLIGLNRSADAQQSLHTALAEISSRLNPSQPDILLLADQGIAYALLGNKVEARASYKKLKLHRAPRWTTSRLEALLRRVDTPVHQKP